MNRRIGIFRTTQFHRIRIILLMVLICMAYLLGFVKISMDAYGSFGPKRVLYINSYAPSFRTFNQQLSGIKDTFSPYQIALDVEFMDTKRFTDATTLQLFYESIKNKLDQLPPYDAIIVSDDNGTDFVMAHREELFGEIPIFFLAVNNYEHVLTYSANPLVTGVFESPSIEETIRMAKSLNYLAENVVVLVDSTTSGQGDLVRFYEAMNHFYNLSYEVLDLSTLTFDEFEDELSSLTRNDLVLLLSVYNDKTGKTIDFEEGLQIILSSCQQPVYHPYEHGIGEGLLGGMVVSHYEQGRTAASLALRYFEGEALSEIKPVLSSPNKMVVDYEVLTTYGLNRDFLPSDVIFLNHADDFIAQNRYVIIWALAIFLLETLLVIALVYLVLEKHKSNLKVKSAHDELQAAHEALNQSNKDLATTNDSLTMALDKLQLSYKDVEQKLKVIREKDDRIQHLIYKDILTNLMNRHAINEALDYHLKERPKDAFALLFIDVDNFKDINDIYGHDIGDEVIKLTGQKLEVYVNEEVLIGRIGGDEFIVVLKTAVTPTLLEAFVTSIKKEFEEMVLNNELKFSLSISIGIALYPDHGDTKDTLLKKADIALYEAKESGKNCYIIYDELMDQKVNMKIQLQERIRSAITEKKLEVFFQPIVNPKKNVIIFEALTRWQEAKFLDISTQSFIEAIEEMGLILEFGEWVFKEACKFKSALYEEGIDEVMVSVNISDVQMSHVDFVKRLVKTLESNACSPKGFCLEMTESIFLNALKHGSNQISELKELGFEIALDDFGKGYSSLSYLKDFAINILKIDRNFIKNMVKDKYDDGLVAAMIRLGKEKEAKVIAEGVEEQAQFTLLKRMGCDFFQGYYFSEPLPINSAIAYAKKSYGKG